ncbi:MAG: CBS domain-containing protein [Myxococcales bacterium]|jgi:CBS domain-containing protein|nr:CBS domain-containing protein [Myxococcales bacterium]
MALPVVRDFMDTVVPTVRPEMPILEAVDFLLSSHVTGAPVVNGEGVLLGMLTEKDCLRLLSTGVNGDVPSGLVRDFMTTKVDVIGPDMNMYFVAGLFLGADFRRFPVVENGKLVGAITRFDVLKSIRKALAAV